MIQGSLVEVLRGLLAGAVVLGILVLLHEWGHFVAAKMCGVRVDVFSIGFGPRIWGVKRGDTDYRLSALPLGGYVRMAGDNPVEERTGADYEFLSRPRWQRFIIAVAGPITNIVLTFLIFWGIFTFAGRPAETDLLQPADVVAVPSNAIAGSGIQPGDRIVNVNGINTPTWESVYTEVEKAAPGSSIAVIVSRGGVQQPFSIPDSQAKSTTESGLGFPLVAPVTDEIGPGTPAEKAGMKQKNCYLVTIGRNRSRLGWQPPSFSTPPRWKRSRARYCSRPPDGASGRPVDLANRRSPEDKRNLRAPGNHRGRKRRFRRNRRARQADRQYFYRIVQGTCFRA
jgi:RIP metalloprotease RseP